MKTYTVEVHDDGSKYWYQNGKCHREDGPAVEHADGSTEWYLDDKYHRIDGPAVEGADGTREWWLNDQLHRTDGPAVEWADGSKQWWLNGKRLTETEFNAKMKTKSCSGKIVEIDGVKYTLTPVEK